MLKLSSYVKQVLREADEPEENEDITTDEKPEAPVGKEPKETEKDESGEQEELIYTIECYDKPNTLKKIVEYIKKLGEKECTITITSGDEDEKSFTWKGEESKIESVKVEKAEKEETPDGDEAVTEEKKKRK